MKAARISLWGIGLALLIAACSSSGKGGSSGAGGTNGSGGGSPNPCTGGQMLCGDSCVNVLGDPNNCGGCGIPCSGGQTCNNGTCGCQSGMLCNGACVSSDATHCGDCTTTCSANQVCSNNACTSGCATGQTLCGTACVVTNGNDALNCGMCAHSCLSTQHCDSGACMDNVATGTGGGTGTGGMGIGGGAGGSAGTGGAPASQTSLVTSGPSGYWQTNGQLTTVTSGNATVTVNDSSTAQTWEGFGGAFNEKGWVYLSMLSDADRSMAMHLLYGADGARFNMGRIPMGASDYAMSRYTDDETPNDYTMSSFSISRDMQNLIPFIKAAQAVNGSIRFWASPWTPPTWMKTGPFQSGGTSSPFDGGNMTDNAQILTAHAQYFVSFVQAYANQQITIETVAPQNEPNYGENYPSCLWGAPLFTKFVGQYLGPALSAANLTTKIMLGTMSNNASTADAGIVTNLMADATAKKYIKVLGYQWTMKDHVAAAKSYNLPIWQTEHQCGNYPWASGYKSTAPNDQAYAVESWGLIRDWIKAGVTAYSAWNMVLDTGGLSIDSRMPWAQNALLAVDTSAKKLNITPTYYVFRHFSQFVAPGAQVVATTGGDAVAFKNRDGSIVTVMYNSGGATTYTLAVGGQKLQFPMPATGWATVNYVP